MGLDDYISSREITRRSYEDMIRESISGVMYFQEIEAYEKLPSDSKELLSDFYKYIPQNLYSSELPKGFGGESYVLKQVKTVDNKSMAAMIETKKPVYTDYRSETNPPKKIGPIADFFRDFLPSSYFSNPTATVSEEEYVRLLVSRTATNIYRSLSDEDLDEEEYKKRLSKFQLVGSQEFYPLSLKNIAIDYMGNGVAQDRNYYIFYSKDGHVFIGPSIANDMMSSFWRAYNLGNYLAAETEQIKQKKYPN